MDLLECYDEESEVYTIKEFFELVEIGAIIPGIDGSGYWGTQLEDSKRSISRNNNGNYTHVWWYAK